MAQFPPRLPHDLPAAALAERCHDRGDKDIGAVDTIARAHLNDVERKIADLRALRRELREIIG